MIYLNAKVVQIERKTKYYLDFFERKRSVYRFAPLGQRTLERSSEVVQIERNTKIAKNTAHNERSLPNFAYLCSEIKYQIMKYEELDNNVVSVSDTETMDLETARQLLHQMVKEVYAKP